ncbi:VOC family protein [Candidatus Kaiserbacteria bacterium]|nr:VOC family protein [Candidatus Kaiserbacteria bacterium]
MKKIYPITITEKLEECKKFYQEIFDFKIVFEAEWYIQLLHIKSGVEIAIMKPNLENQPAELHTEYNGNGIVYSFEVDDAEEEYEKIKEKTDSIFHKLTTEEWGQTHFMLKDPAGVVIDVVEQASE